VLLGGPGPSSDATARAQGVDDDGTGAHGASPVISVKVAPGRAEAYVSPKGSAWYAKTLSLRSTAISLEVRRGRRSLEPAARTPAGQRARQLCRHCAWGPRGLGLPPLTPTRRCAPPRPAGHPGAG
jgi:hypothetical protein